MDFSILFRRSSSSGPEDERKDQIKAKPPALPYSLAHVKELIAANKLPNDLSVCEGKSLLHQCAFFGETKAVKYLVEKAGADLTHTSAEGKTAFAIAVERRKDEVACYLVQKSLEVDPSGALFVRLTTEPPKPQQSMSEVMHQQDQEAAPRHPMGETPRPPAAAGAAAAGAAAAGAAGAGARSPSGGGGGLAAALSPGGGAGAGARAAGGGALAAAAAGAPPVAVAGRALAAGLARTGAALAPHRRTAAARRQSWLPLPVDRRQPAEHVAQTLARAVAAAAPLPRGAAADGAATATAAGRTALQAQLLARANSSDSLSSNPPRAAGWVPSSGDGLAGARLARPGAVWLVHRRHFADARRLLPFAQARAESLLIDAETIGSSEKVLFVSRDWSEEDVDPYTMHYNTIKLFLEENPQLAYVWVDVMCLPHLGSTNSGGGGAGAGWAEVVLQTLLAIHHAEEVLVLPALDEDGDSAPGGPRAQSCWGRAEALLCALAGLRFRLAFTAAFTDVRFEALDWPAPGTYEAAGARAAAHLAAAAADEQDRLMVERVEEKWLLPPEQHLQAAAEAAAAAAAGEEDGGAGAAAAAVGGAGAGSPFSWGVPTGGAPHEPRRVSAGEGGGVRSLPEGLSAVLGAAARAVVGLNKAALEKVLNLSLTEEELSGGGSEGWGTWLMGGISEEDEKSRSLLRAATEALGSMGPRRPAGGAAAAAQLLLLGLAYYTGRADDLTRWGWKEASSSDRGGHGGGSSSSGGAGRHRAEAGARGARVVAGASSASASPGGSPGGGSPAGGSSPAKPRLPHLLRR